MSTLGSMAHFGGLIRVGKARISGGDLLPGGSPRPVLSDGARAMQALAFRSGPLNRKTVETELTERNRPMGLKGAL